MKSEEIFPREHRNSYLHTRWVRVIRNSEDGTEEDSDYVAVKDYCRLKDALEWAEGEIERMRALLEDKHSA